MPRCRRTCFSARSSRSRSLIGLSSASMGVVSYHIFILLINFLQAAIPAERFCIFFNSRALPMLLLASRTASAGPAFQAEITLNDVHSRLSPTRVGSVLQPTDVCEAVAAVRSSARAGQPLAVMGARHAMGGQQFLSGGRVLDLSALDRITGFDADRGL